MVNVKGGPKLLLQILTTQILMRGSALVVRIILNTFRHSVGGLLPPIPKLGGEGGGANGSAKNYKCAQIWRNFILKVIKRENKRFADNAFQCPNPQ